MIVASFDPILDLLLQRLYHISLSKSFPKCFMNQFNVIYAVAKLLLFNNPKYIAS